MLEKIKTIIVAIFLLIIIAITEAFINTPSTDLLFSRVILGILLGIVGVLCSWVLLQRIIRKSGFGYELVYFFVSLILVRVPFFIPVAIALFYVKDIYFPKSDSEQDATTKNTINPVVQLVLVVLVLAGVSSFFQPQSCDGTLCNGRCYSNCSFFTISSCEAGGLYCYPSPLPTKIAYFGYNTECKGVICNQNCYECPQGYIPNCRADTVTCHPADTKLCNGTICYDDCYANCPYGETPSCDLGGVTCYPRSP